MTDVRYVVLSVLLAWVMLMTASYMRSRPWTLRGLLLAFGNREAMPEPTPAAARADRAARNMIENLVLFVAVFAAARVSGGETGMTRGGAAVFFWARLAYFPLYLGGVRYLRTAAWAAALLGVCALAAEAVMR
jgi:uncharacterized MAPEG superfamily protein